MTAAVKIRNTTPRNFARDRVYRVLKAVAPRGALKDPGSFHRCRRPLKPFHASSGPGSINADAEMFALIWAGKAKEAAEFFEAHKARTYKSGAWERSKVRLWYTFYKQGDPRAMGVEAA